MAFLGADTKQVMDVAQACNTASERLLAVYESVTTGVTSTRWEGPDAEQFRSTFTSVAQLWESLGTTLGSVAEQLAVQAAQQDSASSVDGQIDPSDYEGLLGGSLDWSDVINAGESIGDIWREPVRAGDPDGVLGERITDHNPSWDPSTVGTDVDAIKNGMVDQGALDDCWFLAGLMAVQQSNPEFLAKHLTPRGTPPGSDGWTVELFVDGEWRDISVSPDDLGTQGARTVGEQGGAGNVGWASIYEQAMINAVNGRPSAVSADTPAAGLEMITGQAAFESDTGAQPSFEQYKAAFDEGRPITVMTDPILPIGPRGGELAGAHVYHVSGYDESTGELILKNPWGPNSSSKPYEVRVKPDDPRYSFDIFMTGIGEQPHD